MTHRLMAAVLLVLAFMSPARADMNDCGGALMWSGNVYNSDNPRDPDRVLLGTLKLKYNAQAETSDGRGVWCTKFVFSDAWKGTTREGLLNVHGCTTGQLNDKGNCPSGKTTTGAGGRYRSKFEWGPARLDEKAACGWAGVTIGNDYRTWITLSSGWRCR